MVFVASYWWLWVILTVVSLFITIAGFLMGDDSDTAKIVCILSVPVFFIGIVISAVSIILAIIQFAKS